MRVYYCVYWGSSAVTHWLCCLTTWGQAVAAHNHDSHDHERSQTDPISCREDISTSDATVVIDGRVVSWIKRTERGALCFGDLCLPGQYSVVDCPENRNPQALVGTTITGNHRGWIHISDNPAISQSVPDRHGVYLVIDHTLEDDIRN